LVAERKRLDAPSAAISIFDHGTGADVCEANESFLVVDYPDSKKIAGVKNADFKTATYVGLGRLAPTDYYVGEDD
jgi:hypothetical protein